MEPEGTDSYMFGGEGDGATMDVVINGCYGGFSLSRAALHRLRELGNEAALAETDIGERWDKDDPKSELRENRFGNGAFLRDIERHDEQLVQIVGEMGEDANGMVAKLQVVAIPDGVDYVIEEYDGVEWIAEKHRIWRYKDG